jgi:DNA-binding IscR family transcriptional regulator
MAEVLDVLEGPPEDMHCSFFCQESDEMCSLLGGCQIRSSWRKAITQMQIVLRETTLEDIIGDAPGSDALHDAVRDAGA